MMSFLNLCSIFTIFIGLCLASITDEEGKIGSFGFVMSLCGMILFLVTQ